MKKNASEESATGSLHRNFWRWISFSVFALIVAAAFQARSADVFIDEGDGDYAATPVSSPSASGGKAPASEADVPPANPGSDLDAPPMDLEPAAGNPSASDLGMPVDTVPMQKAPVGEAPIEKSKPAKKAKSAHKDKKKSSKSTKSSKKKEKKSSKKSSKKDSKKTSKKSKKKTHSASTNAAPSKAAKRKVAAFFGGEYATTKKACTMESAPGAGDSVGTAAKDRKLWVEDSGNTSYWKVYGKSGAAAFVSRDCF